MHPHSGIATLTRQLGSDERYHETTGKNRVLKTCGLEWMNSGGSAWHQGSLDTEGPATVFQLLIPICRYRAMQLCGSVYSKARAVSERMHIAKLCPSGAIRFVRNGRTLVINRYALEPR